MFGVVKSKDEVLRRMRNDTDERDEILSRAMTHLSKHNVVYVPLDVEEDIEISYQRDDLDGFRETVRGWMRQLRGAS
jgi:hypothetical protein